MSGVERAAGHRQMLRRLLPEVLLEEKSTETPSVPPGASWTVFYTSAADCVKASGIEGAGMARAASVHWESPCAYHLRATYACELLSVQ
jgi:hypothetical protein